jgi:hypothetical protein
MIVKEEKYMQQDCPYQGSGAKEHHGICLYHYY